jgi:hypothetical protein
MPQSRQPDETWKLAPAPQQQTPIPTAGAAVRPQNWSQDVTLVHLDIPFYDVFCTTLKFVLASFLIYILVAIAGFVLLLFLSFLGFAVLS